MAKNKPDCIPCNRPKEKINMRTIKKNKNGVTTSDKLLIENIESQFDSKLAELYNKYFTQNLEAENITDPIRNSIKKKLLSLISIFLLLFTFGCSPDEVPEEEKNTDCTCGIIIKADYFQAQSYNFTVFEVKNNCTGAVKQLKKNGEFKKGNTYCGY